MKSRSKKIYHPLSQLYIKLSIIGSKIGPMAGSKFGKLFPVNSGLRAKLANRGTNFADGKPAGSCT